MNENNIKEINKRKNGKITDGLVKQNVVLMSGLLTGPVIAIATNFENALAMTIAFGLITFITVILCRYIPRKIVYAIRIILYAVIASVVYIPVILLIDKILGSSVIVNCGIYLQILVTNPVILSKTESRFYQKSYGIMVFETLCYISGFGFACLTIGTLRDILINSRIGETTFDFGFNLPVLETTFGGLIFVGIMAGLFKGLYIWYRKSKNRPREENKF